MTERRKITDADDARRRLAAARRAGERVGSWAQANGVDGRSPPAPLSPGVADGSRNNLSWSGLLELAAEAARGSSLAAIDDGTLRQVLFELLAQFFAERDGVRMIYRRYEAWLVTQPWSHA